MIPCPKRHTSLIHHFQVPNRTNGHCIKRIFSRKRTKPAQPKDTIQIDVYQHRKAIGRTHVIVASDTSRGIALQLPLHVYVCVCVLSDELTLTTPTPPEPVPKWLMSSQCLGSDLLLCSNLWPSLLWLRQRSGVCVCVCVWEWPRWHAGNGNRAIGIHFRSIRYRTESQG